MKNQDSRVIRSYFAQTFSWLLSVSILFAVILVPLILYGGMTFHICIFSAGYLIVCFCVTPQLFLYYKARKDIKAENIETLVIQVSELQIDHRHNMRGTTGETRYRLLDENQNVYLLVAGKTEETLVILQSPSNFRVELRYLKNAGLVLNMKLIEDLETVKEERNQRKNRMRFKRVFVHYFS